MRKQLNVMVDNGHLKEGDFERFFSSPNRSSWDVLGMDEGESAITVKPGQKDMFDLLVMLGIFPSKGQAMKNWKKSGREIPIGFSDFEQIGKLNNRLTILNPVGD